MNKTPNSAPNSAPLIRDPMHWEMQYIKAVSHLLADPPQPKDLLPEFPFGFFDRASKPKKYAGAHKRFAYGMWDGVMPLNPSHITPEFPAVCINSSFEIARNSNGPKAEYLLTRYQYANNPYYGCTLRRFDNMYLVMREIFTILCREHYAMLLGAIDPMEYMEGWEAN